MKLKRVKQEEALLMIIYFIMVGGEINDFKHKFD